jgi:lauroyl/myristoyl acyltransferase
MQPRMTRTKPVPSKAAPLIAPVDLAVAIGLPFLTLFAGLIPEKRWPGLCKGLTQIVSPMTPVAKMANLIQHVGKGYAFADAGRDTAITIYAHEIERQLQFIAHHLRKNWSPEIDIEGGDHIDRALAAGKGAILWVDNFAFSALLPKIVLFRLGHSLTHLSHPAHGYSGSRFGIRVLNRVLAGIEDRYLRDRIWLPADGGSGDALSAMASRLAENGLVSINERRAGRQPVIVPFLGGQLQTAPGAPVLALKSGAALLPVATRRIENGAFRVTIDPPIELDATLPTREAVGSAVVQYANRLADHVLAAPGEWLAWEFVKPL